MIEAKQHLERIARTPPNAEPSRMSKVRLDRNERNQPFTAAFMSRLRDRLTDELIMAYPECWPVFQKTAEHIGVPVENVLLHMGSEQAIKLIFETYISPGDKVLLHLPGYAMYPVFSQLYQAEVEAQYYDSTLRFNWEEFINRIRPDIRMVVVENPNGIVGKAIGLDALAQLLSRAEQCGAFVVVDEAYHLFHSDTAVPMLQRFDNLIITRSFSKAFGLAGLRAGCLISRPENIQNLSKLKPAYELSSFSAMALEEMLGNPEEFQQFACETRKNLAMFKAGVEALGFQTTDSVANFMTIRLGHTLTEILRAALSEENILIRRPFREDDLNDWVRISTASAEVLEHILDVLRGLLTKRPDLNPNNQPKQRATR